MPSNPIDFTFVVTTDLSEACSEENKRQVKSAAALKSWPTRRKRTFQELSGNVVLRPGEGCFMLDKARGVAADSRRLIGSRSPSSNVMDLTKSPARKAPRKSRPTAISQRSTLQKTSSDPKQKRDAYCSHSTSTPCPASPGFVDYYDATRDYVARRSGETATSMQHSLPSPRPMPPVSGKAEPFNCYPVPYEPWYDGIFYHTLNVFGPRGYSALNIAADDLSIWIWYITQQALSEPALFYVRLLFASGDLVRLGVLDPRVSLWLKAQAIKTMNEALADPTRATSDAMILAVGRIALHESMYGDRDASNTIHRPAQHRMIQMRGGMRALNYPELVQRLMRWGDRVMSIKGNTPRYLEDDEAKPNFTTFEHIDSSEKWFGKPEAQILKKNIGIADVLNETE